MYPILEGERVYTKSQRTAGPWSIPVIHASVSGSWDVYYNDTSEFE
jgi:hypothetical protein